jgi:6-phosphogluconolactonase
MNMQPDIRVYPDLSSLEDAVAQHFLLAVNQAVQQRARAMIALSGGNTPLGLFKLLGSDVYRKTLPWTQIHFFWVDERCVPETDPESNYGQFKSKVLDPLKIAPSQIHPINGNLPAQKAAELYNSELRAVADPDQTWPRFDWVLLGMGADGHTASLFPYQSTGLQEDQAAIAVQAEYDGRPAERVTLTPLILNAARQLVFMASGTAKATTIREVIRGPFDPIRLPAQRIQPTDGRLVWMLDEAAASQL